MYPRGSRRTWLNPLAGAFLLILVPAMALAAGEAVPAKVDYQGGPAVDSDLDGLTDKGEDLYRTDAQKPDTDGDGFSDGLEAARGTGPTDPNAPLDWSAVQRATKEVGTSGTPWGWYLARIGGLMGFVFLWLTIFLGLAIRNPLLRKIVEPVYSFDFHCFLASSAVFWGLVHGLSLMFDKAFAFSPADVFVPLHFRNSLVDTTFLALGIIAFYLMVVLTLSSYLRAKLSRRLWRWTHFLNPLALIFVAVHGAKIGTDLKVAWIRGSFLTAVWLLVLLYLSSLLFMIIVKIRQRHGSKAENLNPGPAGTGGNQADSRTENRRPV